MHVPRSMRGCVDVPKAPKSLEPPRRIPACPPPLQHFPLGSPFSIGVLALPRSSHIFPHLSPFPLPTAPASCRGAFPICTRAARINGFCVGVSSGTTEGPDPTSEGYENKTARRFWAWTRQGQISPISLHVRRLFQGTGRSLTFRYHGSAIDDVLTEAGTASRGRGGRGGAGPQVLRARIQTGMLYRRPSYCTVPYGPSSRRWARGQRRDRTFRSGSGSCGGGNRCSPVRGVRLAG